MLDLSIRGQARGQERPRVFRQANGATRAVSPHTSWYWTVYHEACFRVRTEKTPKMDGPIFMSAAFFMPRPKRGPGLVWADKRPDIDNIVKAVMDALNNTGVWQDDARVVCQRLYKLYGPPEGARIRICSVTEAEQAGLLTASEIQKVLEEKL